MNSVFEPLPAELFLDILLFLRHDIPSLNQLSLTNRAISQQSREFLFSHLRVTAGDDDGWGGFGGEAATLSEFIEILSGPESSLPSLIQKLHLRLKKSSDLGTPGLAQSLSKLPALKELEITVLGRRINWKSVPEVMKDVLDKDVFPHLTSLAVKGAFENLPRSFLKSCLQLSRLSIDLPPCLDPDESPSVSSNRQQLANLSLRNLDLWCFDRKEVAADADGSLLAIFFENLSSPSLDVCIRFNHRLDYFTRATKIFSSGISFYITHLRFFGFPDMYPLLTSDSCPTLPFMAFPNLHTLQLHLDVKWYYKPDNYSQVHVLQMLSHSLRTYNQQFPSLECLSICWDYFAGFLPFKEWELITFTDLDLDLTFFCSGLRAIHSTFDVKGPDGSDVPPNDEEYRYSPWGFSLDKMKDGLQKLFPRCAKKSEVTFIVEDQTDWSLYIHSRKGEGSDSGSDMCHVPFD